MLKLMQKEIEVLQEDQNQITAIELNFEDFVRKVENNVEKSMLSRRNRQILREKIRENWLFKSKIIPPSFAKIGQENRPSSPKILISPPSASNSTQTCPVTQHQISPTLCETLAQRSKEEKPLRLQCKTSHNGVRKVSSSNRIKSSWKIQFRRDQLNVLQYQKDQDLIEPTDCSASQKNFKVRKVHKKFEEIKHQSCQNYRTRLQIQEKSSNPAKGSHRTVGSGLIYRTKSPQ